MTVVLSSAESHFFLEAAWQTLISQTCQYETFLETATAGLHHVYFSLQDKLNFPL